MRKSMTYFFRCDNCTFRANKKVIKIFLLIDVTRGIH
jgi:hypothetical protein